MFNKLTAFFMTGTGNSYLIAKWFLEAFPDADQTLEQITEQYQPSPEPRTDLFVFTFPTHGFTAPLLMIKFIFRLPAGSGKAAVVLPTRAGTRVLGRTFPGMEGTAGYLIALLLWLRGYRVKAVTAVDMPSNWTALHWGISSDNAKVISERGKEKTRQIARCLASGRSHFSGLLPLAIGLALARISFMYVIIAQLILSKLFFTSHRCNSCGLCARLCPKQAVTMAGGRPYWHYACDSCMACMNFCPQKAIQVSSFSIFLFSYITALPVAAQLSGTIGYNLAAAPAFLQFLVNYAYILISTAAIYWLLHRLLRQRPLAQALERLSHTRYFRRYQAPGVTLNDIHKSTKKPDDSVRSDRR